MLALYSRLPFWYIAVMCRSRKQILSLFLIAAVAVFVVGGFLHEMISHNHHAESVWNMIHSALAHEEKKFLLADLLLLPALVLFVFVNISQLCTLFRNIFLLFLPTQGNSLAEALTSGILAYRKFG